MRERERCFCTEKGKGLDALAFGFHNTVAVYWSDVRAQRSRTKRERERKEGEELKRTNEITIRSGGWIIPGGVC